MNSTIYVLSSTFSAAQTNRRTLAAICEAARNNIFMNPSSMIDIIDKILKTFFGVIKWRQYPGCFERHLQRRYNNPLFPFEKRTVTLRELDDARNKDELDKDAFINKTNQEFRPLPQEDVDPLQMINNVKQDYRQVNSSINESFALGDSVLEQRKLLITYENRCLDFLIKHLPGQKELFLDYQALSNLLRVPWHAQASRADTPIIKDDEVPSFLCEDLETIGFMAKYFSMIEKANPIPITIIDRNEIIRVLEHAYREGFDKTKGQSIINAFDSEAK